MMHGTFTTRDGVVLAGSRRLVDGAPRAAIVLVHGFNGSAADPAVTTLAEALHATGLDVVTYDGRGHGGSDSTSTLGDLERHDVAAAVAVARERTDRVVLVGASMGAIAVVRYATEDPHLDGVVSVSCPARWRLPRNLMGLFSAGLTRTGIGRAFAARHLNVRISPTWNNPEPPIDLIARITAPVALVHGSLDKFIMPGNARELFGKCDGQRRLVLVPDMGHAYGDAALQPIVDAVEWALVLTAAAA